MSISATGQQDPRDAHALAYQPGYWLPHEQADPYGVMDSFVDPTYDPYGFELWAADRSEANKGLQPK